MDDLIKALQIFRKYTNEDIIHCEHDTMNVCIDPEIVSDEDKELLAELSFDAPDNCFESCRFGSC